MNKRTAKSILEVPVNGPKVKSRAKKTHVPSSDDPRTELKTLVSRHKALVKSAVALENMCRDRVARQDVPSGHGTLLYRKGDKMPCRLPLDVQVAGLEFSHQVFRKAATQVASAMKQELNKLPIFYKYLQYMPGFKTGGVIPAYLVSDIDIHKAVKPSQIIRYCGMAVINGRLERNRPGEPAHFSTEMRTRMYQLADGWWRHKNHCPDNKYLKIWQGYKNRILNSERVIDRELDTETGQLSGGRIALIRPGEDGPADPWYVSAPGFAHSYGWHQAVRVFLEDLYIVWRSMEGLPVWPSYYAAKLGYHHGGRICVNAPKLLSLEEALCLVDVPYEFAEQNLEIYSEVV